MYNMYIHIYLFSSAPPRLCPSTWVGRSLPALSGWSPRTCSSGWCTQYLYVVIRLRRYLSKSNFWPCGSNKVVLFRAVSKLRKDSKYYFALCMSLSVLYVCSISISYHFSHSVTHQLATAWLTNSKSPSDLNCVWLKTIDYICMCYFICTDGTIHTFKYFFSSLFQQHAGRFHSLKTE